jgi:hypothetical protein
MIETKFNKSDLKASDKSQYWKDLDSDAYQFLRRSQAAYKKEIELNLEPDYPPIDVGQAISYLYRKVPYSHLSMETRKGNTQYDFYYTKSAKQVVVKDTINKKFDILERFAKVSSSAGVWANTELFPNIVENLGFFVNGVNQNSFGRVKIASDYDIILDTYDPSHDKIFIDVKNRLQFYDYKNLRDFVNILKAIKGIRIIPVVVARAIFDTPLKVLASLNGIGIEMERLLMPQRDNAIVKEMNVNVAPVLRTIPDRLIPPDIKKKFTILRKMNTGFDFSSPELVTKMKPLEEPVYSKHPLVDDDISESDT